MTGEITDYGTGWQEAELIMAIHEGDHATVQHHIQQMLPTERETLRRTVLKLYWTLSPARDRDGKPDDAVPFRSLHDPEAAE
jgi:hypothetical protein